MHDNHVGKKGQAHQPNIVDAKNFIRIKSIENFQFSILAVYFPKITSGSKHTKCNFYLKSTLSH